MNTEDIASDSIAKHNLYFCGIISMGAVTISFFACKSMLLPHVHPANTIPSNGTNSAAQGRL